MRRGEKRSARMEKALELRTTQGLLRLVAWDGIEPPTQGFSRQRSVGPSPPVSRRIVRDFPRIQPLSTRLTEPVSELCRASRLHGPRFSYVDQRHSDAASDPGSPIVWTPAEGLTERAGPNPCRVHTERFCQYDCAVQHEKRGNRCVKILTSSFCHGHRLLCRFQCWR